MPKSLSHALGQHYEFSVNLSVWGSNPGTAYSKAVTHPSTNATHTVISIFAWLTEQVWKFECCTMVTKTGKGVSMELLLSRFEHCSYCTMVVMTGNWSEYLLVFGLEYQSLSGTVVTRDRTCHLKIMSMTLNPLDYAIKDKNLSQLTCLSLCLMHLAILVNSQSTYQSGVRTRVLRISKAVTHPSTNATHTVIPIFSWLTKEQAWKVECCTNGHNDLQGGFRWNSYSQGLEHCSNCNHGHNDRQLVGISPGLGPWVLEFIRYCGHRGLNLSPQDYE